MKCVVAGPNVKIFGKAIHTLAKIGDELYLESLETGLAVRTVNASRSAFAGFTFPPNFFLEYDERGGSSSNSDPSFKGKLTVRSVLFVFKRLADMDKSVERCIVSADSTDSRVVFTFHCKYGIVKTHKLAYIESETLVVNHDKAGVPNRITSPPLVFIDAVACFNAAVVEIVFEPFFDRLVVRNHCDEALLGGGGGGRGVSASSAVDPAKSTSVKFSLSPQEFDVYVVKADDDDNNDEPTVPDDNGNAENNHVTLNKRLIRFCLKELRALLSFAETYASSIGVYFGEAGEPIVFSLDSDPGYEADFVFATSPPDEVAEDETAADPPPAPKTTTNKKQQQQRASPVKRAILTQQRSQRPNASSSRLDDSALNESVQQTDVSLNCKAHDISRSSGVNERGTSASNLASVDGRLSTTFNQSVASEASRKATLKKLLGDDSDDDNELDRRQETISNDDKRRRRRSRSERGEKETSAPATRKPSSNRMRPSLLPESDEEDDPEDVPTTPPSTPPSKKFKSIFGCSDSQSQNSFKTVTSRTQNASISGTQKQVLAEDSEDED